MQVVKRRTAQALSPRSVGQDHEDVEVIHQRNYHRLSPQYREEGGPRPQQRRSRRDERVSESQGLSPSLERWNFSAGRLGEDLRSAASLVDDSGEGHPHERGCSTSPGALRGSAESELPRLGIPCLLLCLILFSFCFASSVMESGFSLTFFRAPRLHSWWLRRSRDSRSSPRRRSTRLSLRRRPAQHRRPRTAHCFAERMRLLRRSPPDSRRPWRGRRESGRRPRFIPTPQAMPDKEQRLSWLELRLPRRRLRATSGRSHICLRRFLQATECVFCCEEEELAARPIVPSSRVSLPGKHTQNGGRRAGAGGCSVLFPCTIDVLDAGSLTDAFSVGRPRGRRAGGHVAGLQSLPLVESQPLDPSFFFSS